MLFLVFCCSAAFSQQKPDGPTSVSLGDVYRKGNTTITDVSLTALPPLPAEYTSISDHGYRISTEAEAAGPYKVIFNATSVTDELKFKSLRVLHGEPDEFDPAGLVWQDRTCSKEIASADFSKKIVVSCSKELDSGFFVLARFDEKKVALPSLADLQVTVVADQSVRLPEHPGFTISVKNNGPDPAHDVGIIAELWSAGLVSATPSQGTCKEHQGHVYCKLNEITPTGSATVKVVLEANENLSISSNGTWLETPVQVGGKVIDQNPQNNSYRAKVLLFPNPNLAPSVSLEGPLTDRVFNRADNVSLRAIASDSDGTITRVEFFDESTSLGNGLSTDGHRFSLLLNNLHPGLHYIAAVASDNGGRKSVSDPIRVFINGPTQVSFLSPQIGTPIEPGSTIDVSVRVKASGNSVSKVELFRAGISLGLATQESADRYSIKLHNADRALYSIDAEATDSEGLVSRAPELNFVVSNKPKVSIISPRSDSVFESASLKITANATEEGGRIERVEIYANGSLIGSAQQITSETFVFKPLNIAPGKVELRARVIDDLGLSSDSSPIVVRIKNR
jgi:hypothetical protein